MKYYTSSYSYGRWEYLPELKLWTVRETASVTVRDQFGLTLKYQLLPGFRTDGGSVPGPFTWLIKGWYNDGSHNLTNLAFAIHDTNYALKLLSRGLSDDMLRGMLRDDDWSRVTAGTVCWAVNNFASRHYGTDDLENAAFVRFII